MEKKKKRFIYYSSPEHWFQTALELNSAIIELYNSKNNSIYYQNYSFEESKSITKSAYSKATYLLMSYALENLLKGIAIIYNPSFVNEGKINKRIKTHYLNELSSLCEVENDQFQTDFQLRLSVLCLSNARYPVGVNENIELSDPNISIDDFKLHKILFQKYKLHFTTEYNRLGWDSGINDNDLKTKPGEFNYYDL